MFLFGIEVYMIDITNTLRCCPTKASRNWRPLLLLFLIRKPFNSSHYFTYLRHFDIITSS
jgi:hypothetical protein